MRRSRIAEKIAFPLLFIALITVLIVFWKPLWQIFQTPENLREWVVHWGLAAPVVFILLQILQVVVFIIPGEVPQLAGGYLFGIWLGFLYSLIGIAIGSTIDFFLARWLGVPFVRHFIPKDKFARIENIATSTHAQIGFFLLFLIPGIPKDILCYVAGLSPIRFGFFLLVSLLGRFPGLFGSNFIGGAAAQKRWPLVITLSALAVILFLAGYFFRNRLQTFISRISAKRRIR